MPESRPQNELRVIAFEDRHAIELWDGLSVRDGFPLEKKNPEQLRELTFSECESLAKQSSPVSRQLESHRNWLKRNSATPTSLLNAMSYQAEYESRAHVALALESYLNLVEVYVQQSQLNRVQSIITDAEAAIVKFRDAGVDAPGDSSELHRQSISANEKSSVLWLAHGRLNSGLEAALDVEHQVELPVWTDFSTTYREETQSEADMVDSALTYRGDLLAIKQLASDIDSLSNTELRSFVSSANPLLGASIPLPPAVRWWQCILQQKSDYISSITKCELQRQLYGLVETKEKLIRQEVAEVFYSLRHHREMLELKEMRMQSLTESMDSEAKAKDDRPINFATRVNADIQRIQLMSEIVHEMIAVEIEYVRLDKVLGVGSSIVLQK